MQSKLDFRFVPILLSFLVVSGISSFELPAGYDRSLRPNNDAVADYLRVSAKLLSIRDIDENGSEMSMDLILSKQWTDSRLLGLVSKDQIFSNNQPEIWMPDLFFQNSISSKKAGEHASSIRLGSDGSVSHSERLAIKLNCPMKFTKFPFDKQFCDLTIGSYGYTRIHLDLIWHGLINDDTVVFDSEFSLSSVEQSSRNMRMKDGEYSLLIVSIVLARSGIRYGIRAFLPSILLAVVSYATLYVRGDPNNSGSHKKKESQLNILLLGLNSLVMSLFILIAQLNTLDAPTAATITAYDIWMYFLGFIIFTCLFASLLQAFSRKLGDHQKQQHCESSTTEISPKSVASVQLVNKFEYYLKVSLPILLILFIIIYFAAFLS